MEESELLKLLMLIRKKFPNIYRHIVGFLKAIIEI